MIPQDIIELECVEHATLYSNVKGIMNWGICPRAKGRATAMASTIPLDYHRGGHTRAGAKNPSEVDCVLCLDQTMLAVAQLLDSEPHILQIRMKSGAWATEHKVPWQYIMSILCTKTGATLYTRPYNAELALTWIRCSVCGEQQTEGFSACLNCQSAFRAQCPVQSRVPCSLCGWAGGCCHHHRHKGGNRP